MKKAYNEIMEKIEVNDEMRERIINNIRSANLTKKAKVIHFHSYRTYLSIAACFIFLVIGAIKLPSLLQEDRNPDILNPTGDIVDAASSSELSELVGFKVKTLTVLPFEVRDTIYSAYWNELAEITYSDEKQTAVFRMSVGQEENSGDYNSYSSVIETNVNGNKVMLKGEADKYSLAVWLADKYSYSILLTNPISEDDWLTILDQVK